MALYSCGLSMTLTYLLHQKALAAWIPATAEVRMQAVHASLRAHLRTHPLRPPRSLTHTHACAARLPPYCLCLPLSI